MLLCVAHVTYPKEVEISICDLPLLDPLCSILHRNKDFGSKLQIQWQNLASHRTSKFQFPWDISVLGYMLLISYLYVQQTKNPEWYLGHFEVGHEG